MALFIEMTNDQITAPRSCQRQLWKLFTNKSETVLTQ
jgi:hypothetical protein